MPLGAQTALRIAAGYDQQDNPTHNSPLTNLPTGPLRRDIALRTSLRQQWATGEAVLRMGWARQTGTRQNDVPTSHFFKEDAAHNPILDAQGNAIWAPVSGNVATLLTRDLMTLPMPTAQYGLGAMGHSGPWIDDTSASIDGEVNQTWGPIKAAYIGGWRHSSTHENGEIPLYSFASGMPIPGLGAPNPGCPALDFCSFPVASSGEYAQISQELRLTTRQTRQFWLAAGAYYIRETSQISYFVIDSPQFIVGPGNTLYGFANHTTSTSLAGYGEAGWRITPHLRLTAGLRETHDDKARAGNNLRLTSLAEPTAVPYNAAPNDARLITSRATWRLGLDADLPGGLVWATASSGYNRAALAMAAQQASPAIPPAMASVVMWRWAMCKRSITGQKR